MASFYYGFIPHLASWGIVATYFFHGVTNGDPPNFVWAIIFVLFFTDGTFAINMYLQQKEIGPWSSYYYGEVAFCVLSLVAKSILAW
jgi:hypothetical protein